MLNRVPEHAEQRLPNTQVESRMLDRPQGSVQTTARRSADIKGKTHREGMRCWIHVISVRQGATPDLPGPTEAQNR